MKGYHVSENDNHHDIIHIIIAFGCTLLIGFKYNKCYTSAFLFSLFHKLSFISDLFHRGYGLSGSALSPSTFQDAAREKAHKLAAELNCPTNSSLSLVNCLKTKPGSDIVVQTKLFQVNHKNIYALFVEFIMMVFLASTYIHTHYLQASYYVFTRKFNIFALYLSHILHILVFKLIHIYLVLNTIFS